MTRIKTSGGAVKVYKKKLKSKKDLIDKNALLRKT